MSLQFWGAMIALPIGHFLFEWLANPARFTRELVKLLAAIVFSMVLALVAEIAASSRGPR